MFRGGAVTTRAKTRAAGQPAKRKPLTKEHRDKLSRALKAYHKTCKKKPAPPKKKKIK